MRGVITDLTGRKFGLLTVKERVGSKKYGRSVQSVWRCVCECGNERDVLATALQTGRTKSCTCFRKKRRWLG